MTDPPAKWSHDDLMVWIVLMGGSKKLRRHNFCFDSPRGHRCISVTAFNCLGFKQMLMQLLNRESLATG